MDWHQHKTLSNHILRKCHWGKTKPIAKLTSQKSVLSKPASSSVSFDSPAKCSLSSSSDGPCLRTESSAEEELHSKRRQKVLLSSCTILILMSKCDFPEVSCWWLPVRHPDPPPADSRLDSIPVERTQRQNTETFLESKPLQCSTVMNEWGQKLENKLQKCVFSKHHIFSVSLWRFTLKMRPLPFLHLLQLQLQKNSVGVKTIFISIPNRLNTFNYNPTYILLLALFRGCFRKHWWNLTLSFGWTQFQFPFSPAG